MSILLVIETVNGDAFAHYASEAEAVTQAMHDMELGAREIKEIKDDGGRTLFSHEQLLKMLHERLLVGKG